MDYVNAHRPDVGDGRDGLRSQYTILVVDDEQMVRDTVAAGLSQMGYDVVTAENGLEALHFRSQEDFDAVILDVKMPGLDGIEVLHQIKARFPRAVVIIHTALPDPGGQFESTILGLGAEAFLRKPVGIAELTRVVEQGIAQSSAGRAVPDATRNVAGRGAFLSQRDVDGISPRPRPGRVRDPDPGGTAQRPSVLVVDDEQLVRDTIAGILEEAGYDVVTAEGGFEALYYRSQESFDAMILDVKMPEVDGLEVLQQLKARHPDAVVIMLTALPDPKGLFESVALKYGAAAFLKKPVRAQELNTVLERVLEGSSR